MRFIENFMLAHPAIMSMNTERFLDAAGHLIIACACLFCAFNTHKRWPSWSLMQGKLFRLSWLAPSLAMMVQAYGSWRYPEQKDIAYPWIEIPLCGLWFLLMVASMYLEISRKEAM